MARMTTGTKTFSPCASASAVRRKAIYQELVAAGLDDIARRDPDAIEAVYRKLNEAEAARRDPGS
jgi:hypothetical protein